jgi:hypothetical protein
MTRLATLLRAEVALQLIHEEDLGWRASDGITPEQVKELARWIRDRYAAVSQMAAEFAALHPDLIHVELARALVQHILLVRQIHEVPRDPERLDRPGHLLRDGDGVTA